MVTGRNAGLSMTLMLEQYRLFGKDSRGMHPWVDAGYCIDAPAIMAAGSMVRDEFGQDIGDWLAMESMTEREPSNVEVRGAEAGSSPERPSRLPGSTTREET